MTGPSSAPPPLRLGSVVIDPPVLLAPMAGYTDAAFRSICADHGCPATLTEVTNAAGLVHGSAMTWHLLERRPEEQVVGAHLYGSDPAVMAEAARRVHALDRFAFLDVNAGCPVRKIVAKGAGVALMRSPERLYRIVQAMCAATPLPVTVKTRIGIEDPALAGEVAAAAQDAGAAALFLHARLARNHHHGPADWDTLAAVKAALRIPVVGNGGINSAGDIPRMLRETGVDGVMIGRAAVGAPWLFAAARAVLAGRPEPAPPDDAARRAVVQEHLARALALAEQPQRRRRRPGGVDSGAALHFRAHLARYLAGYPDWRTVRQGLQGCDTTAKILAAVARVMGGGPAAEAAAPLSPGRS